MLSNQGHNYRKKISGGGGLNSYTNNEHAETMNDFDVRLRGGSRGKQGQVTHVPLLQ